MKKYNPGGAAVSTLNISKEQKEKNIQVMEEAKAMQGKVFFAPKGYSGEFKKKGQENLTLKEIKR